MSSDNDYLFHYTSIDKLALILTNKTIRLNPLNQMDDPQEGKFEDLEKAGQFFFVSSWTDDERENIAMWNMYTSLQAGVRIALPKNPFVRHGTKGTDIAEAMNAKQIGDGSATIDTFLDMAEMLKKRVYSPQEWSGEILVKITYTDDESLLVPRIVSQEGESLGLDFTRIGRYKNTYWETQKEWRYLMSFFPLQMTGGFDEMRKNLNVMANGMAKDMLAAPFKFFDLDIRQDALDKMIIIPSPKMDYGNRILLDSLLKTCGYKGKLQESELSGLL